MISTSKKSGSLNITLSKFNSFFSNFENVADLFESKRVNHLQKKAGYFSFLLKRVAVFEFQLSKENESHWVQYDSTHSVVFKSAFRFVFEEEDNSIELHFQTDTSVFMELFLEKRINNLLIEVIKKTEETFSK